MTSKQTAELASACRSTAAWPRRGAAGGVALGAAACRSPARRRRCPAASSRCRADEQARRRLRHRLGPLVPGPGGPGAARRGRRAPGIDLLAAADRATASTDWPDLEGPAIFAANHHSHVDTPLLLTSIPEPWRHHLVRRRRRRLLLRQPGHGHAVGAGDRGHPDRAHQGRPPLRRPGRRAASTTAGAC